MSNDQSGILRTLKSFLPGAPAATPEPTPSAVAQVIPPDARPYAKGFGVHVPPGTRMAPIVMPDPGEEGEKGRKGEGEKGPVGNAGHPLAGRGVPEPTVVKTCSRKPPQPPTLEIVLEQFRLYELRPLTIGKFCIQWLQRQPELPPDEQLARGEALRRIRDGLVKQGQVTMAARLDRFIACYWIAAELGWDDAWKLRYAALRELQPLFGRNAATEEYALRPERAEATKTLWARMVAEHLTAEAVRAEVRKIRPPHVVRLHGRSGRFSNIRRELNRLKAREDLLEFIRLAQERLQRLGTSSEVA